MNILDLQTVHLNRTAAALVSAFNDEQVMAHVSEGDVVLRVVGPFPHIAGCGGIKDRFPTQECPNAARYRFDMVHRSDHLRVVAHSASF
jgi:hypothetical protein